MGRGHCCKVDACIAQGRVTCISGCLLFWHGHMPNVCRHMGLACMGPWAVSSGKRQIVASGTVVWTSHSAALLM